MYSTILVLALCIIFSGSTVGQRYPRIQNGLRVPLTEFPHQVFLRLGNFSFCGGAIIDTNHVLTAAYCLIDENNLPLRKRDVTVVIRTNTTHTIGQLFEVSEIRIHEKFFTGAISHNIAMLKLTKKIIFNDVVQPINLPTRNIINVGSTVTASGFKKIYRHIRNTLPYFLKFDQIIISDRECSKFWPYHFDPNDHFCARSVVGSGTSGGDNGNAVIADDFIVGINSVSSKRGSTRPNIYLRIDKYLAWINRGLKNIKIRNPYK